jgi:soluble cytochrome b562
MKRFLSHSALLALLVVPTARLVPQDEKKHKLETELERHMETIEDTAKVLRKNLKDPATWPAALEALSAIQREALACKSLVPAAAEKLPEAERAAFVTAYRRTMVDFLTRQLELEAALLDGNADAAKAAFERFRAMEDSSHERFAPEDD